MVNQELVEYLKTQLSQGYTAEQMRGFLTQQGYSQADVDDALMFTMQEGAQPQPSQFQQPQGFQSNTPAQQNAAANASGLKKRPGSVSFVSIMFFIAGFLNLLFGVIMIVAGSSAHWFIQSLIPAAAVLVISLFTVIAIAMIFSGAINVIAGWGLWNLKNWARILAIVLSALAIFSVITLPLGIIFIILLTKKSARECFA
ncbi:MAG: DUF2127 domain-containing protein [Candidatus Woesearchaeota archaeon]